MAKNNKIEDGVDVEYLWEASYTDSKYGDLVRTTVVAKDENDAWDLVVDDYYFGSMVSLENTDIIITDMNRRDYE